MIYKLDMIAYLMDLLKREAVSYITTEVHAMYSLSLQKFANKVIYKILERMDIWNIFI